MNDLINTLPETEWDKIIKKIISPFNTFVIKDALLDRDDLKQEAWISLLNAVDKYDPSKGKFVTFAYNHIRWGIIRYIKQKTSNKPHQFHDDELLEQEDTEDFENNIERRDLVSTIMSVLSDQKHTELLIEYFVHNKSLRRIATEYDVCHETVKSRIKKLLCTLEKRLSHNNVEC